MKSQSIGRTQSIQAIGGEWRVAGEEQGELAVHLADWTVQLVNTDAE